MHRAPTHPSWCEYPDAPGDATHTHTAAIGTTFLAQETTIELVLVQPPGATGPALTLHVTAPTARHSIDLTGVQAWALAGILIDATVAHAHAGSSGQRSGWTRPNATATSEVDGRPRPIWLLDRHPDKRMPQHRTGRRAFRCRRKR
jgi:hypothetical protein